MVHLYVLSIVSYKLVTIFMLIFYIKLAQPTNMLNTCCICLQCKLIFLNIHNK